jgi:hypothetical protein
MQESEIRSALAVLEAFDRQHINYRVLGSLLVAAMHGRPHRPLGDVDILLDEKDRETAFRLLKRRAFALEKRRKAGVCWTEAKRSGTLPLTFMLVGRFERTHFAYALGKRLELTISSDYLRPHRYTLFGRAFTGIPPRSVYEGIRIASLNPKRTADKQVLAAHFPHGMPRGKTIAQSFRVYIGRLRIPGMYVLFSFLYNVYGGVRVLFGKRYEIWD